MQLNPRPLNRAAFRFPHTRKRINILGTEVDSLSKQEILEMSSALMTSHHTHHIITANSLLLMEAQKSKTLRDALRHASLVIPDSTGVSWAALTLYFSKLTRYPGIDLAYELCGAASKLGVSVYLLGGESGVAKKASRHLYAKYSNLLISGMRDGFFQDRDETAIFQDIARCQARLVLVALGMPKQEEWIYKNFNNLPPALYIGIGGSFDVWAGKVRRAPKSMQSTGLEWLYRAGQEPSRFRRISQLPRFALKVFGQRLPK